MEEVSTRRASLDDYGAVTYGNGSLSNSLMEATMHDVMSLEMSHHDLGDTYLDPRSFGGLNSYDDYSASHPSSYSANSSSTSSSSTTSFESVSQSSHTTRSPYIIHTSSTVQSKYDNPNRFESQLPPPTQRVVPTYPVKTANPATCTQYAPVRTILAVKTSRRSHSRSANKKEPLDPQRLEDEVARNVSQIMSATKQQKLIQEAQMKNGIITNPKALFSCPDCGKGMTSQRNLQRHRQASCAKRIPPDTPPPEDDSAVQTSSDTSLQNTMITLPGMDTFSHSMGSFNMHSEMNDWCSNESFSPPPPSQPQQISTQLDSTESLALDTASHMSESCLAPLSLETDDSHTHSSSASHCSSNSAGNSTPQGLFTCGSCKKSVCSFRSLKRHHTTCKQFIAEFGPPENEKVVPTGGANVCADCNRQLCSASNLKRHRATCKIAIQNARLGASSPSSQPSTPRSSTDGPEKDVPHQPTTRNSSARFAAAEQRVTRQSQASTAASLLLNDPELQQKPWITVGEHLRAQHHKAKLTEGHKDVDTSPSTAAASSTTTTNSTTSASSSTNNQNNASSTNNNGSNSNGASGNSANSQITARVTYYKLDNMRPVIVAKPKTDIQINDNLSHLNKNNRFGVDKNSIDLSKKTDRKDDIPQVNAVDQKKWKIAQVPLNGESLEKKKPLESIITTQPLSNERLAGLAEPMIFPDNRTIHRASYPGQEFQCPECKKNYSCRKNVKRHRMAVHKLTADEIARFPAVPCTSAVQVPTPTLSTVAASSLAASGRLPLSSIPKVSTKCDYKTEVIPLSPTSSIKPGGIRYCLKSLSEEDDVSSWCRPSDYDEETAETARIAAELKRSAEQEVAEFEGKRPRTELAEADTTFHEESEHNLVRSHHSSPGVMVSSSLGSNNSLNAQSLPSISSWIESSKPLTVDIPPLGATRSANSSPSYRQRRQFLNENSTRILSSDYSNRRPQQYSSLSSDRSNAVTAPSSLYNENFTVNTLNTADPLLGHSVNTVNQRAEDEWYRIPEDVPDSTTSQRLKFVCVDRSTSPVHIDHGSSGLSMPETRKRSLSGSSSIGNASGYTQSDPKQARHLCQACGKFYSSEWNLERHKRESCPTKPGEEGCLNHIPYPEEVTLLLNGKRYIVSRNTISNDFGSFQTFFSAYDLNGGEIILDVDANDFRVVVDIFNKPHSISANNIDLVTHVSDRLKIPVVFDLCVKYISEELPKISVMHALRLADEYRFLGLKQRLLDSISIDVFRSLSADHNYKLLDAELKAELLEKWGTFL